MIEVKINVIPKLSWDRAANTAAIALVRTARKIKFKKGEAYLRSLFHDDGTQGVRRVIDLLTSDLEEKQIVRAITELYSLFRVVLVPFSNEKASEPLYFSEAKAREYMIDTHCPDTEKIILCILCDLRNDGFADYRVHGGSTPVPSSNQLSEESLAFLKQNTDSFF